MSNDENKPITTEASSVGGAPNSEHFAGSSSSTAKTSTPDDGGVGEGPPDIPDAVKDGAGHNEMPREAAATASDAVEQNADATVEPRQDNPSETAEDLRADQRREFERLMIRASALQPRDHEGARDVLIEAYGKCLPNGETTLLQGEIVASTGLSWPAVRALTTDAANYTPEHGYLPGIDELVTATRAELERRFGGIIATEGRIFVYSDTASADTSERETHYWRAVENSKLEEDLIKWFPRVPAVQNSANRKQAIQRLHPVYRVDDDYFQKAPPGVGLANGFLGLNTTTGTVKLEPHSKEHRTTYRLQFCYDRSATAGVFTDGLLSMLNEDQDKAACVLQFMFAVMFRYRPVRDRVRTVMFLQGLTGAGKSTLTELIRRFVPEHLQASVPPDLWSDGYFLSTLRGVLLNTVTEIEPTAKALKGAVFKLVASHEPVTCRQIKERPVTFVPQARHLFACNRLPTIGESDRSLERRLIVISVPNVPDAASENPNFLEDVWEEAAGIVNLLLQESLPMLTSGKFTLPADNQKLIVSMQFPGQPEEHVARLWLEPAPGERVWSIDLQRAIRIEAEGLDIDTSGWHSSTRMKPLAISIGKLYGAIRHVTEGNPYYLGVRLKQEYAALLCDANRKAGDDLESVADGSEPDRGI
jgi:hypothetical protein